jgi:uncharacterized membrane protein YidH (DUF202 family)
MPRSPVGLALVATGVVLVLVGLAVWAGGFSWFGRLPGDIRIERPNSRIYVPITSGILLSIVLSIVLSLLAAFMRRGR